jgi:hypothetical protein
MGKNNEENLIKALELYESGKSVSEILNLWPEDKELAKIFDSIILLEKEGKKIIPSKELLAKIIDQIRIVTDLKEGGYLYKDDNKKGRSNLINQIHEYMSLKWKIGIPVGIVAIALAFFVYNQYSVAPELNSIEKMVEIPEVSAPVVTANIDNAVDSLILAASEEQAIFESELSDVSLLEWDSSALSDFGQTYDENLF